MRYISTRGQVPAQDFSDVVLEGLARDGGLFMPESIPVLDQDLINQFETMSYQEIAFHVMRPYVQSMMDDKTMRALIDKAYKNFHDTAITPLKKLDDGLAVLELFHGPTLAFKDVALQFLGPLFQWALEQKSGKARGGKITILGATSGDTGSAAIQGCQGLDGLNIFILHPKGRVSDVQRKQMTTVLAENVFNIAVEGHFDDCQYLVKDAFADEAFRDAVSLSAINSINWARIMAQIPYYFYALSRAPKDKRHTVVVPTGNFGNIFAGYLAKMMGAPVDRLIAATNKNDALYRFFETGEMRTKGVEPSLSPSMDIQVPSNFERWLYLAVDGDSERVRAMMSDLREKGTYQFDKKIWQDNYAYMKAYAADDEAIERAIGDIHARYDYCVDPHTATGLHAYTQDRPKNSEMFYICLGCAHPVKFPEVVIKKTGVTPQLPDFMADLMAREERLETLDNNLETLKTFIKKRVKAE